MSEFADDGDVDLVMRAREKCARNEIDKELLGLVRMMKERKMSPSLCDLEGNPIAPGTVPNGFTIRVGVCTCTQA